MLMKRPGRTLQTSKTSSGKIPLERKEFPKPNQVTMLPRTSGPKKRATNPPIIELGRNSF
jgi:hypothetical protein